MQRTGRKANILNRPSNERSSACLNFRELHIGHSRLIQSNRGIQAGHTRFEKFICTAPSGRKAGRAAVSIHRVGLSSHPAMRAAIVCCL